ncbi:MAG: ABC transporter ATP-binding protein, partial [Candidatus Aminicenantales bacterium]
MNPPAPPLIETRSLSKTYLVGDVRVAALADVTLAVPEGSFLAVTGASGSGKSTLLNLLGGLDTPSAGTIEVGGALVSAMDREALARYRRFAAGMIFQSFNLVAARTALENVELPLIFAGVNRTERKRRAAELLGKVGLAHRANHRPPELSGGEQQRVAVARALANGPRLLLADEPTGNL